MKNSKIYFLFLFFCVIPVFAQNIKHIHFLIPGGKGGGWDKTARSVGEALNSENLVKSISYENMSGKGGGKALSYLIETAPTQKNTLMVNSTPIVIRSLQDPFAHSFRDLTLIASLIADYQVLVVKPKKGFQTWSGVISELIKKKHFSIGGGSSRGGMDHLVGLQILKKSGININKLSYKAYDAGGKALQALIDGQIDILSTGLGEVLEDHRKQNVVILGVTSPKSILGASDIATFKSLGINVSFTNWRGFFGPPGLDEEYVKNIQKLLKQMIKTPKWQEIKNRNGWNDLYKDGKEFQLFLREQEESIGSIIKELGVL